VGFPVPFADAVDVPHFAVFAPDPPALPALGLDGLGGQRGRVQVDAVAAVDGAFTG